MWEFSLNLNIENIDKAKRIYRTLSKFIRDDKGVVTSHEENGYIYILIAVKGQYEEKVKTILSNYIIEIICNDFKMEYLEKHLSIPDYDKIGICAYKKALLNFDNIIVTDIYAARETNRYGVSSQDLVDKINSLGKKAIYIQNFDDIIKNMSPLDVEPQHKMY